MNGLTSILSYTKFETVISVDRPWTDSDPFTSSYSEGNMFLLFFTNKGKYN